MKKQVPYSVYLPVEYLDKIKELAKKRQASSTVRDAICMILDGNDSYKAGYNKAIKDASRVIKSCKEIEIVAIRGKYLDNLLIEQLEQLSP